MRILRLALRLSVPVALLTGLLWALDGAEALALLARAEPGWLAFAALLLTIQTVLMALRWRLVSARLGAPIPVGRALGEYYLAQIVNMTVPGGVAGDAARAWRARGGSLARAAQAVAIERIAGQATLFVVAWAGFAAGLLLPGGIAWPGWTGAALGAVLLLPALAIVLSRLAAPLRAFAYAIRRAVLARTVWLLHGVLGLSIVAANLGAFAASARATGTTLGPEAVVTLVPLILTAMLMPLSVGGWGWREGAAAALLPMAGASAAAGLAASLAYGLVMLAASLPGLLWPLLTGPARARAVGARIAAGTPPD